MEPEKSRVRTASVPRLRKEESAKPRVKRPATPVQRQRRKPKVRRESHCPAEIRGRGPKRSQPRVNGRTKSQVLLTLSKRRREGGRRRRRSHSEEKGERSHHHSNPGGRSSASKPEPRPSQRPESDPPAKLRPRSPSHPPPGRGRGQGWSAAPRRDYRQEEWKPQDWKNKGVKKTETQRYFKEFLAQKRGL